MFFKHFFEPGLAQNSYLVGCQKTGESIVIDPRRDIDEYLSTAAENGLRITHITETHIHADFLSGTRELAEATGGRVLLSDEGGADWLYQFDHEPLRDGDRIRVGNLTLDVLHTPGHTPEHVSFLLTNPPAGSDPVMVFTGDFVFVGDVGRPDLLEEAAGLKDTKVIGARQMFHSLKKFRELPEYVQVWPAHGAGSACGKSLGAVPSSTVGYELRTSWALQVEDEDEFVAMLLDGQPEPPYYFAMMKRLNKAGADLLSNRVEFRELSPNAVADAAEDGAQLVDTRSNYAFVGGHIPGSYSIPDHSGAPTWAGWLLSYDRPIVLIADRSTAERYRMRLTRVGFDRVVGYLPSVDAWADTGRPVETTPQLQAEDVVEDGELAILDVRGESEFQEGHIRGAHNVHAGRLPNQADGLPRSEPLVVHCQSGFRSVIATSVLQSLGFEQVHNLVGGLDAWQRVHPSLERESRDESDSKAVPSTA